MNKGTPEGLKKLKNMRTNKIIILLLIIFIATAVSGCIKKTTPAVLNNNEIQSQVAPTTDINATPNYYNDLEKQCQTKPGASCCLNSVARMQTGNFKLAEAEKCPAGFERQMLLCQDTLIWCQPIK